MMDRQQLQAALSRWNERVSGWLIALRDWLQRARTHDVDFAAFKGAWTRINQQLRQLIQRDYKLSMSELRPWFRQHGRKLGLYVGSPIITILAVLLIQQQTTQLSNTLALRPAQLTAIQSLIQDSKTSAATETTPLLTDNEIETLRVILQNRGITPNVLRLNLDQGGSVELQTDQANFGQWVSFLEEAARRWHLFPTLLTIKASDSPEIVSIRATLQQNTGATP